jgi:hypothetical protein
MEDVVLKLKADGKTDEEAFAIAWGIYKKNKRQYYDEGFFGKPYPVMDAGQRGQVIKIAKKWSGNMQRALIDIEKIRAGLTDNPDVMDILKTANEDLDLQRTGDAGTSKSVKEKAKMVQGNKQEYWKRVEKVMKQFRITSVTQLKNDAAKKKYFAAIDKALGHSLESVDVEESVDVDRRTIGFKQAMMRAERAKKVREKAKLKKEKKKENEILDARYDYDGEVDVVLAAANKKIFGETAANAVASGGVDMAPNAGKKKKDKFKVVKQANY